MIDLSRFDITATNDSETGEWVHFASEDPSPLLLSQLTYATFAPLPMHAKDKIDLAARWSVDNLPDGLPFSGPYVLNSISEDNSYLSINPHYYEPSKIKSPDILVHFGDTSPSVNKFLNGETDFAEVKTQGQLSFSSRTYLKARSLKIPTLR